VVLVVRGLVDWEATRSGSLAEDRGLA
jgi:hypothetical protein